MSKKTNIVRKPKTPNKKHLLLAGYIKFKSSSAYPFTRFMLDMNTELTPSLKPLFKKERSPIQMIVLGYKDMDKEPQVLMFNITPQQSNMLYDSYIPARRFLSIYHD